MNTGTYGITKPVSLAEPTDDEMKTTQQFSHYVDSLQEYETPDELQQRNKVLREVHIVFASWVKDVAKNKGIPEEIAEEHGLQILTHGGQHIGVVSKGGDIDLVAVVPVYITHKEFFTSLKRVLLQDKNASNLRAVEGAYVPVLKFQYHKIQMDVCLSVLTVDRVPTDLDLCNMQHDIYTGMDTASVRSLTGARDGEALLQFVPNAETFCLVLKFIKIWAKNKHIYGSALGYPGGIAWSIMVARVCQLYPNACAAVLVHKFFVTYKNWHWKQAVLLQSLAQDTHNLKPWNPKITMTDAHHIMPVITPVYPEHNCTFTVTKSNLHIIQDRLTDAEAVSKCILGKEIGWQELLIKAEFFSRYKHFLMVTAHASTKDELVDWGGLVEAKLRVLVLSLEKQPFIDLVQIYTRSFGPSPTDSSTSTRFTRWLLGLSFKKTDVRIDLAADIEAFNKMLYEMACNRNIYQEGMNVEISHLKRKQLKEVLQPDDLTT